ncbi:Rod shape-determining protein RodA [Nitrospina gracilis 3/211]|uniref:Peptidoglycan glycosyltransferase RodA n=1 Tax=Nitrospina gracilis (strain 3/211) TaxID=1266370 RepID=M1YZV7_NITG3|nr:MULTISPECIES: rod shape-determining protein RodA [Nitrospina]MCF8723705.1 rod shape determining protein RodA [Nitrospina sp. Nb-3]CCQ90793.1 Rod shape-determining protein RodA [Nitrospina gracilis 3/211]
MMDRRLLSHFNLWYFLLILVIAGIGVITIHSANHTRVETFFRGLYLKQIYWILVGLVAMFIAVVVDYRVWSRYAWLIYAGMVLALLYVLFFGKVSSGAQRWIHLGPLTLQVSEFAKYALIIILAKYFEEAKPQGQKYELKDLVVPFLLTAVLGGLIALQPDLGTALIIFFIFFVFVVAAEMEFRTLWRLGASVLILAPLTWFLMKGYQKQRVMTLFNPELDPLGAGYHTIQSKIAVGSGGFWGKGLYAGTQSRLNFLPEKHTDFIFSVYAEEMGFLGVMVLFTLFLILVLKGLNIAYRAADRFGVFLGLGIVAAISFYIIFNIGMTVGLFPVTGLPLPLMSYGGSSLITTFFALGLLLNIEMRRNIL